MARTCCICGKKQSGWLVDYPLSVELNDYRICASCGEKYQKILQANKLEDVKEEIAYIKQKMSEGEKDKVVIQYLSLILDKENESKSVNDISKSIIAKRNVEINNIKVTSGYNFEGYKIVRYCDYISAEAVLGMGALKALFASVSNITGTESTALNCKIDEAKNKVIHQIKEKALELEANAIIGIDIDFTMFADTMVVIMASGTAVVIQENVII